MKKQTKKIEITEYVFSKEEAKILKICLDYYCWHRLNFHESGIDGMVSVKKINKLRKELRV